MFATVTLSYKLLQRGNKINVQPNSTPKRNKNLTSLQK